MDSVRAGLVKAEAIAKELFKAVELRGLIVAGKDEKTLNKEIFLLAKELFGIEKHWHKRIVRSGENTLCPYTENPPNRVIEEDDILFFDFGPIIENWEADLGRTYVLGTNPRKLKLKNDIEQAWIETKEWFDTKIELRASELYNFVQNKAIEYGWELGGEIAGHLIGAFPHEKLESGQIGLYIHPDNPTNLFDLDKESKKRHWILEMYFIDRVHGIGGFYEQLLT